MGKTWIVGAVFAGVFFYWFRCRYRFWFGLIEVAVAIVALTLTFYPTYTYLTTEDSAHPVGMLASLVTDILFGIYILVRGLDNIEHDLPSK